MKPQNQSAWDRLPKAVKIALGVVGCGLFIALLILQAGNSGAGFSCH
jgi:hypothetical protein